MNQTSYYHFLSDYGMAFVLLLLCAFFSVMTWSDQPVTGEAAAMQVAEEIQAEFGTKARVLIVARKSEDDAVFAAKLEQKLKEQGVEWVSLVRGQPTDARQALVEAVDKGQAVDAIACNQVTSTWGVFDSLAKQYPALSQTKRFKPRSYSWPTFLKAENLLNIANQIAVIAIIAIGMTLVIITGGIDLSVGSLIALSAIVTARLIRDYAGAESASTMGMIWCSMAGIGVCGLAGMFSGSMVTWFRIPPFIVTLGLMLVASGLAYIWAEGASIDRVPTSFVWLGRGADVLQVPNAVLLMLLLYGVAHVLMSRTMLGRYIYAVGGNMEAARLSGVPIRRVLLLVYTLCGLLAGLGGVVMASQLKSGAPTYGQMYELYVIAAVVVGGTSLSGGEGKILGTLIGAFIIAVIQNGMNLTNVESYSQKVVLGMVILGAVLIDRLKRWNET